MDRLQDVLEAIRFLATEDHYNKLSRFGINDSKAFGVKIPLLRQLAKEVGRDHTLAMELWNTGYHEARILASFIENPKEISPGQMDSWVADFDSWDVCDQCCNLFVLTPFVYSKIRQYISGNEEFVRRTGFVLMCEIAMHDKNANLELFVSFFELIEQHAGDERNFVKKAVNWALRQIGKRNEELRLLAIECAERVQKQDSRSAKWIASDAIRELRSEKTIEIVRRKTIKKGTSQ